MKHQRKNWIVSRQLTVCIAFWAVSCLASATAVAQRGGGGGRSGGGPGGGGMGGMQQMGGIQQMSGMPGGRGGTCQNEDAARNSTATPQSYGSNNMTVAQLQMQNEMMRQTILAMRAQLMQLQQQNQMLMMGMRQMQGQAVDAAGQLVAKKSTDLVDDQATLMGGDKPPRPLLRNVASR